MLEDAANVIIMSNTRRQIWTFLRPLKKGAPDTAASVKPENIVRLILQFYVSTHTHKYKRIATQEKKLPFGIITLLRSF